ncbi:general secretion pathway protein GspB [Ramlibacter sp.]|uniref:general secretion pathway protein GspB n=1 Tax=Ramlibacter sp. TaxID=1917967 RepID=UPI002B8549AB|nr:general secretion pathway protein GspB [Ramlibacter sp.]HWI81175.1 general secretion pathway protein GspB [Ramlibacter sp.]
MGAPAAAPATVPGAAPAVPPPGATGRVERSIGSTPPPVPGSPLGGQPGTMPAPRGFAVPPATAPSPVPAPAPVPVPPGVPPMTVPPAPPAAARVPVLPTVPTPPVTGLPPDAPKLVINGGVYSPRREHRIVIVNGQIVREGADLGSGVLLEQIRPTSVVLAFRGTRYNVNY